VCVCVCVRVMLLKNLICSRTLKCHVGGLPLRFDPTL